MRWRFGRPSGPADVRLKPDATNGAVAALLTAGLLKPDATNGAVAALLTAGLLKPDATNGAVAALLTAGLLKPDATNAAVAALLTAGFWILAAGCGPSAPALETAPGSPEALARAVLEAFERRDEGDLRALALTEREFRDHVWPELPAARPGRNVPFSYVWGDLHQKSESALSRTLATRGGRHYELVGVRFLGETTQYDTYVVHRETALTVKDTSGAELQLRLFGSTLEKDGRFKVFSYVVD